MKKKENQYQLHMLAVACLETTVELEPAVREKVETRLSKLVPPKTMADAKALAAAGEIAIKYLDKKRLPRKRKFSATSRAACVRTLAIYC